MKRVALAKARESLGDLVNGVHEQGERIKITRYGRTRAWLVSVEDGNQLPLAGPEDAGSASGEQSVVSAVRRPQERTRIFRIRRGRESR